MTTPPNSPAGQTLVTLLEFGKRARNAESATALQFMLVNETFSLVPYQLAIFWTELDGVVNQSGVSSIDRHAPFVLWLSGVLNDLSTQQAPTIVSPEMLSSDRVQEWSDWMPAHALWLPIDSGRADRAGLLLCKEVPWTNQEIALLSEWTDMWEHEWMRLNAATVQSSLLRRITQSNYAIPSATGTGHFFQDTFRGLLFCLKQFINPLAWYRLLLATLKGVGSGIRWALHQGPTGMIRHVWQAIKNVWVVRSRRYTLILLLIILFPVKLTVLAPAELVAENPAVIRVPTEGVIETFFVKPNETVKKGQLLFKLDLTQLISKLQIAQQEMQVALAEYRQSSLQSLTDPKSRSALVNQEGKAIERQLEAEYLKVLLEKAQIKAPRAGIAIFDDPSEWLGKPVVAGEKIMVIATENKAEIEVWLPLNEAIELGPNAPVSMYLNTTPLSPVTGTVRYVGHDAIQRPDGSYAYRLRATIDASSTQARIGLRGTARLSGQYVPFSYWILRKPLVAVRQFFGV